MKKMHIVKQVEATSIAHELGIEPGDVLISVNEQNIEDVFDYHYLINDDQLTLLIEKVNGEEWELEIEKEYEEDLGILFNENLMDEYRSCCNKCIFCFIDQMPEGMRETLYFKDDDSRLSFLQGNYVTLTNMSEKDIERIIHYHLEPINISFHTTNPELRCKMLHNRFAGEALAKVDMLFQGRITMNGQIVLCKGVNDREELERSIRDLTKYLPYLQSVSVVPVGITKYREGLYPLDSFTKEDAKEVLAIIHTWQEVIKREYGTYFVYGSDEWYILAEEKIPKEEKYDGYLQLENGVGMTRLLLDEFEEAFQHIKGDEKERTLSIATGALSYQYIKQLVAQLSAKFKGLNATVYCIVNDFFGEQITVSGLITGRDLIRQLKGKPLGDRLLLPINMLRNGEDVFLDDVTLNQLKESLQVDIEVVKPSGEDFIEAITKDRINLDIGEKDE